MGSGPLAADVREMVGTLAGNPRLSKSCILSPTAITTVRQNHRLLPRLQAADENIGWNCEKLEVFAGTSARSQIASAAGDEAITLWVPPNSSPATGSATARVRPRCWTRCREPARWKVFPGPLHSSKRAGGDVHTPFEHPRPLSETLDGSRKIVLSRMLRLVADVALECITPLGRL
jgi:hypothetical protein